MSFVINIFFAEIIRKNILVRNWGIPRVKLFEEIALIVIMGISVGDIFLIILIEKDNLSNSFY